MSGRKVTGKIKTQITAGTFSYRQNFHANMMREARKAKLTGY
jgi:hypothetical protein